MKIYYYYTFVKISNYNICYLFVELFCYFILNLFVTVLNVLIIFDSPNKPINEIVIASHACGYTLFG